MKLKQCSSWTCTIVLFSRHTLHCICNLAMSSQFIIIDHKLHYGNGLIVIVCHLSVAEPLYLHYVKTAAWPDLLCKVHSAKCILTSTGLSHSGEKGLLLSVLHLHTHFSLVLISSTLWLLRRITTRISILLQIPIVVEYIQIKQ